MRHHPLLPIVVTALIALASSCSEDETPLGPESITAAQVLAAPIGTVMVDGSEVRIAAAYRLGPVDEPLLVMARVSRRDVDVTYMWVVSGDYFAAVESPDEVFDPQVLTLQYETSLMYQPGLEFVTAVGIKDSQGRVTVVRSELTELIDPPPLPGS
jgi:hypothetical protein